MTAKISLLNKESSIILVWHQVQKCMKNKTAIVTTPIVVFTIDERSSNNNNQNLGTKPFKPKKCLFLSLYNSHPHQHFIMKHIGKERHMPIHYY